MKFPIEGMTSGQRARLISTLPDSKREEKATSVLLAALMVVPDYARSILSETTAQMGVRSRLECYVEVGFSKLSACRPDGLIVVRTGSRVWTALVESKVRNSSLELKQVDEYLDLAKLAGIDALITISNEFVIVPTHHPLKISKVRTRNVNVFHFSWLSLISKSILLSETHKILDPEQSFILGDFIHYLEHPKSGVVVPLAMSEGWRDVADEIQNRAVLRTSQATVIDAVTSWIQLLKYLALRLSLEIGRSVQISVPRAHSSDANAHFQENIASLVSTNTLVADFDVPDAAAKIQFTADFSRRTINISLKVSSPTDRSRATAAINWLTRQLKHLEESEISIRGFWGRRVTTHGLGEVMTDPTLLIPRGVSDVPKYLELARVVDLSAKFKSRKSFAEISETALVQFYEDVVQHVNKWVPKPPSIKKLKEEAPPVYPVPEAEPNTPVIEERINRPLDDGGETNSDW